MLLFSGQFHIKCHFQGILFEHASVYQQHLTDDLCLKTNEFILGPKNVLGSIRED